MNKKEIINYLKTNNKAGHKTRKNHFFKYLKNDYDKIILINFTNNWYEQLYCYLNNINKKPICKNENCNNYVNFKNIKDGYYTYCSIKCRNTDNKLNKKIKEKFLKKYGVDNPMKLQKNIHKSKQTRKEKYGDENYVNSNKSKQTRKEKYGDENYNNRRKSKQTRKEKYGNENYTNRELAKQTSLNRYGDKHYNNRNLAIKTNLKKYNVPYYNNINKIKKTCKLKYGVDSYTKSLDYKLKIYDKTIINYANKLNIDINDISYDGNNFTIKNFCNKHSEFTINKYVLKNRIIYGIKNICTKCNPINEHVSIKENEIKFFIDNILNIKFISNDRKILMGKEIDIYIPDHNLGIEFDGLYYHSNKYVDKDYHLNKTEECEKQNIQLLHIFEDEWTYKKEIVKSIIKNKLGINDQRIFGRKTEIKEINNNNLIRNFLEKNHIQGFVGSSIKLGLFYKNELVSLMTFGKKRIATGSKSSEGNYEILRFCNKLNTQVIGGASKLLKYFIKNYQPKSILTFADRRYSNGNLYKQLGFEYVGNSKPNYWYFKKIDLIRYHRFNFRKDILIKQGYDPNKTEHEIMIERNFYHIYDSGNLKFKLEL